MTKKAILFVNLGSAIKPSALSIGNYLREFLSDTKVVDLPRIFWLPLLYFIILPIRSFRNIPKYRAVWLNKEVVNGQEIFLPFGSPLHFLSSLFLRKAQTIVNKISLTPPEIRLAMRYGKPNINWAVAELEKNGCEEILLFPLYPQFSNSTTQTVIDKFAQDIKTRKMKWQVITSYHSEDFYINSLVEQITKQWREAGKSEKLLLSFHGLPVKMINNGDPYQKHCEQTAQALRQKLNLTTEELIIVYQSRFGNDEWLKPATESTLIKLAQAGVKSVDIICPGFAVDCLETLEEINVELREVFLKNGGEKYNYINCLNEDDNWINNLIAYTTTKI